MRVNKQNRRSTPDNSSMVKDEHDLIKHSKVMENMNTNSEIEKGKQQPDPRQYGKEDIKK
ncbi:hypothetical protein FZW96_10685 [Bacillus sp. BGMRC 2118]|nr:hypothetical protein FZW96_10685 [Bacillus sp. BGMRC 2118]